MKVYESNARQRRQALGKAPEELQAPEQVLRALRLVFKQRGPPGEPPPRRSGAPAASRGGRPSRPSRGRRMSCLSPRLLNQLGHCGLLHRP